MGRGGYAMCTDDQLKNILNQVAVKAKEVLRDRLRGAYLYGSYARGDYDAESDVDILLLADVPQENLSCYKKPFLHLTSELGLEYDTVITVTLKDAQTFSQYQRAVPFYQTIRQEGIPFWTPDKNGRTS